MSLNLPAFAINWHIKSEESRERISAIDTFVGLLSYYISHDGLCVHRVRCHDCKPRGEANCRSVDRTKNAAGEQRLFGSNGT